MLNGDVDQDIDGYDWPDKSRLYQSSTIEHLDDFNSNLSSLFQRPELSDLTLVIERQDVRVNKCILAARSEYFHALLYNGMKESFCDRIELPMVELKSFKLLLRFLYSGILPLSNLTSEELVDLLMSARFFCLEKLVCDIALYLRPHINKSNVWLLYKVSKLYYIDQLAKACERFFDRNAENILLLDEFNHLDIEELKEMVKRDSFYAPEKAILRAISVYYSNNSFDKTPMQCVQLFTDLLEPVRLSLLSVQEIRAVLSEFDLPIHDSNKEDYQYPEKQRSSFPIQDRPSVNTNTINTSATANLITISPKRSSNTKASRKKLKIAPPVLSAFAEAIYRTNFPIDGVFGETIDDLLISRELMDDCSTNPKKSRPFPTINLTTITHTMRQKKESIRGYLVYNKNIATKDYKVEPVKGRLKKDLVSSTDRNYNIRTCTNHTMSYFGSTREEYIQVAFGRPFIVNNIRMLLLDDGQRSFSYTVEASVDGKTWQMIVDYSRYWCRSWQHLFFKERVMKHVRITGTRSQYHGTGNSTMSVVYFDCMYNTMDSQMYKLTDDCLFSPKKGSREYFIEPKSSVVEMNNTIALTTASNGTMRHFRLRAKTNPASNMTTNPSIPTSPNPNLSIGPSSPTDHSSLLNGSNASNSTSLSLPYRTTDFARGSANWNCTGKVIFQLAQPFKISSFAFKIFPTGYFTRSNLSFNISISNDLERNSWKSIGEVSQVHGKDFAVVKFEAQLVTFIEIRSTDYPNHGQFSVKHFECPFISEHNY